jgi:hemolysin activation/secretion protein
MGEFMILFGKLKKLFIMILGLFVISGCAQYQYVPYFEPEEPVPNICDESISPQSVRFAIGTNKLDTASKENLKDVAILGRKCNKTITVEGDAYITPIAMDYLTKLGEKHLKIKVVEDFPKRSAIAYSGFVSDAVRDTFKKDFDVLNSGEEQSLVSEEIIMPVVEKLEEPQSKTLTIIGISLAVLLLIAIVLILIKKRKVRYVAVIIGLLCGISDAYAANSNNALETFQSMEEEQRRTSAISDPMRNENIGTENVKKNGKNTDRKIVYLNAIKFTSSTILQKKFFDEIRNDYVGKKVSANDIKDIVKSINDEYAARGYIAARAYLPKQDINTGTLHISLIEGKLDNIKFEGVKRTSENYLRRFFVEQKGDDINMHTLTLQTLNFNAHSDLRARMSLEPGDKYGTTDINVVITEPNLFSFNAFTDNAGQTETGLFRYGASASLNSITGYRDIFTIGALASSGTASYFASYDFSDPWLNAHWGLTYDHSDTQIIAGDMETLDIKGKFDNYGVYMKNAFLVRRYMINHFGLNLTNKRGHNFISQYPTQTNNTTVASLSFDNLLMLGRVNLFNAITLNLGTSLFGGGADYFSVGYSGEAQYSATDNLIFDLRWNSLFAMPKSGQQVPSSEKIALGGSNSVRGYKESLMLSDKGYYGSFETRYNMSYFLPTWLNGTSAFVFFDYGQILDLDSFINIEHNKPRELASIGLGARMTVYNMFDLNLTYAHTLIRNILFDKNADEILLFFRIRF